MSSLSDLLSTFAIILAMVVCLMLCSIILAAILEFIEMRKKSNEIEGDVEMCHPEKRSKSQPEINLPAHIQIKRKRLFSVPMSKKKQTQNQASISPKKLKPVDLKLVLSFSSQLCQYYLDNKISLSIDQ